MVADSEKVGNFIRLLNNAIMIPIGLTITLDAVLVDFSAGAVFSGLGAAIFGIMPFLFVCLGLMLYCSKLINKLRDKKLTFTNEVMPSDTDLTPIRDSSDTAPAQI